MSGNIFGLQTATLTKEKEKVIQDSVKKESDDTIDELPDPPKLELRDGLLNTLCVETDDTLDRKFVNQKEQEDAAIEQIKKEYNFDDIKDAFDERAMVHGAMPGGFFSMELKIVTLTKPLNFCIVTLGRI